MQILKKIFLVMTSSCRHEHLYDTHHGVAINRAKFGAYTSNSFKGVETDALIHRQTELRFI